MLLVKAEVRSSPIHGLGCFAQESIAVGDIVWEFNEAIDRQYSLAEFVRLPVPVREHFRTYAWVNPADRTVIFSADHSKFFNHSDTANTAMTPDGYQCIAVREVAAGEELTSNYAELLDIPDEGVGPA